MFSNWVVLAASILYALVMTPLIVQAMGVERYGVWSFLNGLLAYSELLYLGLGSALVKYVAQFRAHDDHAGINRVGSVVATIYLGIGLACLIVLTAVSRFIPGMLAEPLAPEIARAASITCVLLGVRLLLLFISSAFAGLLSGHDRFDLVNAVTLCGIGVRFLLTPFVLSLGDSPLLALAWLTATAVVLDAVALPLIAFRTIPRLSIRLVVPRSDELRWLYGFGLQSFFILFAVKLIAYTDTTVIGLTLGAASVAAYSLPLQLVEYTRMAIGGFAGVFLPQLTILKTRGDEPALRDTLIRVSRIGFFMAAWTSSSLIVLGPAFLDRWIGATIGSDTRFVLLFLALATWLHVLITQVPLGFYQALHLMARPAIILLFEALANILLSIVLAPRFGINGVAMATLLPVALVSFIVLPRYLARQIGLSYRDYLRRTTPPGIVLFAVNLGFQLSLGTVMTTTSYSALAIRALLTLPLASAVFWLLFPASERARFASTIDAALVSIRRDTA